tara:strand:+ start:1674 stop:2150 length:477 start_codon:yes stop_codon:yes gene_type:complete
MKNGLPFKIEYDTNYTLIAIISSLVDYQFAYYLNKKPHLLFKRMSSDLSYIINNQTIYFSIFQYNQPELQRSAFLIQNKSTYKTPFNNKGGLFQEEEISNTIFLIPELKEFDYLMKLVGVWKNSELSDISLFLNKLDYVDSQNTIDLQQIKSINNIVF